jgi:hypothetical protein
MSRNILPDRAAGRRLTIAAGLFAAAMLAVFGTTAWTLATRTGKDAGDAQSLGVCCSILLVLASVVNFYIVYGRTMWAYRCPQCTERATRVPPDEAGTRIRFRCPACNIDWDIGWNQYRSTG